MPPRDLQPQLDALSAGFRRLKGIGDDGDASATEIAFDEWDWEVGVGLFGDFRAAQDTGNRDAMERIARWYDWQLGRGLPRKQVNSVAPMLAFCLLAQELGRTDWQPVITEWADFLMSGLPKTEEGGFQHTVKERDNEGQLWDDTLFMAVMFLAAAGTAQSRQDWVDEAHYQFLTHVRHLGDVESGLFFHGWNFNGRHHYARALWARGNAWLTIAIPELFKIAPPSGPVRRYLIEVLSSQVTALSKLQREDGMFHTLLNDPASPVESSGTAGIAYGTLSAIRQGLVSKTHRALVDKAERAILSRIDANGFLEEVSDGTPMGPDLEFYRQIPNLPTPYGQALCALFLMELQRDAAPD